MAPPGRKIHCEMPFQEKGKGQLTALIFCSDSVCHTSMHWHTHAYTALNKDTDNAH